MMSTFECINEILSSWICSINNLKKSWVITIKDSVESAMLTKLEAMELLTKYKLLPLDCCVAYPEFMNSAICGDNYSRGKAIYFYDIVSSEYDFLPIDGSKTKQYADFPYMVQEEAINLTYDYIIEHSVIGCYFDW